MLLNGGFRIIGVVMNIPHDVETEKHWKLGTHHLLFPTVRSFPNGLSIWLERP